MVFPDEGAVGIEDEFVVTRDGEGPPDPRPDKCPTCGYQRVIRIEFDKRG